jgi:hypothetical protein
MFEDMTFGGIIGDLETLFGNPAASRMARTQQQFNQQQSQANPFGFSGPMGSLAFQGNQGIFSPNPQQAAFNQMMQQQAGGFLQGQPQFQNQDFSTALGQNNLTGAMQGANQVLGQQAGSTAFGGLGGLNQQSQQLGNLFGGNIAQGPQFGRQGEQNFLFNQGANFLNQAGNQQGLIQQNLDASRALAAPFEERQRNALQESIFGNRRSAVSGGGQRDFGDLLNDQGQADAMRVLGAQQLGLQQQGQLAGQGLSAFGQGTGLFGASQAAGAQNFGQQLQGLAGQQGIGMGTEQLGFSQALQGLQQNQSAGQQRLQNAMNLFGLGSEQFQQGQQGRRQDFLAGLQGQEGLNQQQQLMQQLFLGSLGADAQRIGAQADFSRANTDLVAQRAENTGFLSGLFG